MRILEIIKQFWKSPNARNGAIYTIFSFLNRGISFLLILLLAGYLTQNDYGSLNLFNTFVTLIGILITLGTTGYVAVSFFQKKRAELNRVIGLALFVTTVVLILLSLLLLLFPNISQRIAGINLEYLFIALFISYASEITNLNLVLWQLEEKPMSYGFFTLLMAALNFALTIWFIIGLKMNWEGRAYSQLIVSTALGAYSWYFLIKRNYISFSIFNKSLIFETFAYSLPLLPHMMSFWVKQSCDRYIINYFWDSSVVGVYSFALNFAAIIGMIGTAFNASNSIYIYKDLAKGYRNTKKSLDRIISIMTLVYLTIFFIVWIGSYLIIPLIIPKYNSSLSLLFPICFGAFAQCLYLLHVNYLFFFKRTRQLMYITFSTAILQLIASLILTKYSILFTAYISMIISVITFILVMISAKRILSIELLKVESTN